MERFGKRILTALLAMMLVSPLMAEEADSTESKVEFSVGADLVSSYVWRGTRVSGISFQPSLGMSYKGLSLGCWASSDFKNVINEFDWTLFYEVGGFSVGITDYFGPYVDTETPKYFADKSHILEGTLGFDFSAVCEKFALSVTWNTNFLNDEDAEGKENFSTYIELGYPVDLKPVSLEFALGLTPWSGMYADKFNVVNISVKGSKEIPITDRYALPLFTQLVLNPSTQKVAAVFGLSF